MVNDPRALLETLIRERGEDYASLSRLIGRNPAYIQQFIKRGVPRKLDEEDRRILAHYFGVDEALLGAPPPATARVADAETGPRRGAAEFVAVPRLAVRASAGPGALAVAENAYDRLRFDGRWLREVAGGSPAGLSTIRVTGDSMVPTLNPDDEILVNRADAADRIRDGIYVLRIDDMLVVKRIAIHPAGRTITIHSDNPSYPPWPDCDPASIDVIGRVVWAGRRIS
ncbi:MAG TPA: S24 family peptidase [Sphingomonadaceae bacterium]|nr:S24 family peptidase [Sphingomonadaceae bacterium]